MRTHHHTTTHRRRAPVAVAALLGALTLSLSAFASHHARVGPVAVTVTPQYSKLTAGQRHELHVLVELEGHGKPSDKRVPMHLALVIDRSGSMRGGKLDSVKRAAREMVDRLGRDDRVTLISYSSDVRVHSRSVRMDREGRAFVQREISHLGSGGGTALGPALFRAIDLLEGKPAHVRHEPHCGHRHHGRRGHRCGNHGRPVHHPRPAPGPHMDMAHVLLLSDGLANEGISDPAIIAKRAASAFSHGVSVSTLGVGLDYNEDLMTRVADEGGGRYHFVKEDRQIAGVLGDELKGLKATVARNVEVQLRPAGDVRVGRVWGYATGRSSDGQQLIRIGQLAAGQKREVMLRLDIGSGARLDDAVVGVGFSFRNASDDGDGGAETNGRVLVEIAKADSVRAMWDSEDTHVTVRLHEVQASDRLEAAARDAERGDFGSAERKLRRNVERLRAQNRKTPSKKLEAQIEFAEDAIGGLKDASAGGAAQKAYIKSNKARAYRSKK